MLRSLKALDGFVIAAQDGTVGRVKDIYFDDLHWTVRFLEVDTGGLIDGRRVLIPPPAVIAVDWRGSEVSVRLTRQQVQDSPGIDTAVPVARQHEAALFNYYGYPYYWSGPYVWGYTALPTLDMQAAQPPVDLEQDAQDSEPSGDPHLRSKDEVIGYAIQASDDSFGRVADFLIDEQSWTIRLLVVDTRTWWPGGEVLVPPSRVREVSWEERSLMLDVTRSEIESCPEYDADHPPEEDELRNLYRNPSAPVSDTRPGQGSGPQQ